MPAGRRQPLSTLRDPRGWIGNYGLEVAADNPIVWWRLGDQNGYATDFTGNLHTGTLVGGVTTDQPGALVGFNDKACSFDGSTGQITVPDHAALRLNGSWS